jgi:hypothetical protein
MMISSLLMLTLIASAPDASLSSAESQAINVFIKGQAKQRTSGGNIVEEFPGGRQIARGDLDGDGKADLVVLFTLEQGNVWTQFLSVFGSENKPFATMRVGGKGRREVELRQVTDRRVELATKNYGPLDALCCPSIVGHSWLVLHGDQLEEAEFRRDGAGSVPQLTPQGIDRINANDGCRPNSALVGPCFEVQGRAFASNGTPSLRIAIKNTKRVLGVVPPEDEIAPRCFRSEVTFKQDVVGRFIVCPFSQEKAGAMRMVCVEEVRDAAIRSIVGIGEHGRERRIEDCQMKKSGE